MEYTSKELATGIIIAIAIVFVAIIALNFGEIVNIIATEGLLSE